MSLKGHKNLSRKTDEILVPLNKPISKVLIDKEDPHS